MGAPKKAAAKPDAAKSAKAAKPAPKKVAEKAPAAPAEKAPAKAVSRAMKMQKKVVGTPRNQGQEGPHQCQVLQAQDLQSSQDPQVPQEVYPQKEPHGRLQHH